MPEAERAIELRAARRTIGSALEPSVDDAHVIALGVELRTPTAREPSGIV